MRMALLPTKTIQVTEKINSPKKTIQYSATLHIELLILCMYGGLALIRTNTCVNLITLQPSEMSNHLGYNAFQKQQQKQKNTAKSTPVGLYYTASHSSSQLQNLNTVITMPLSTRAHSS